MAIKLWCAWDGFILQRKPISVTYNREGLRVDGNLELIHEHLPPADQRPDGTLQWSDPGNDLLLREESPT